MFPAYLIIGTNNIYKTKDGQLNSKKTREQQEKRNKSHDNIWLLSMSALRKLNVTITAYQWNKQHY